MTKQTRNQGYATASLGTNFTPRNFKYHIEVQRPWLLQRNNKLEQAILMVTDIHGFTAALNEIQVYLRSVDEVRLYEDLVDFVEFAPVTVSANNCLAWVEGSFSDGDALKITP